MATVENQNVAFQPSAFKKVINEELPLFYGNQQQDAAEFLNFFLDKMNEELNRVDQPEAE
jgi:ubiquitin C-terminal hydrolase